MAKIKVVGTDPGDISSMFTAEGIPPKCLPVWLGGSNDSKDAPTEPPKNEV